MARKKLQGQVAIITGGGRGIGAATARVLAQAGASVVLTARSEEQLEQVAKEIGAQGGRALAVAADVSDLEQIEEVIESAIDQFGRVDILINNAGIVWPIEEIIDCDPEEWAYNIHTNLIGAFNMIHNVLPLMREQGYGRIVNVTSAAAHRPIIGLSAYCAAKAGMDMLTKTLALEIVNSGITVNSISPGLVDTEMQTDIRSVDTSETNMKFDLHHDTYNSGKLLPAELIGKAIYWIAGPWGREHNGVIFTIGDETWRARVEADLS